MAKSTSRPPRAKRKHATRSAMPLAANRKGAPASVPGKGAAKAGAGAQGSVRATAAKAPVNKAPVAKAPVAKAPVTKAPAVKAPAVKTPASAAKSGGGCLALRDRR